MASWSRPNKAPGVSPITLTTARPSASAVPVYDVVEKPWPFGILIHARVGSPAEAL